MKKKYYHIETFGCQMNERDSETVAGMLEVAGYERAPSSGGSVRDARLESDVIVVNTCSVRENADNRFFGVLGQIKHAKEARADVVVAVCGCMMEQPHIVNHVRDKFPWVDIIFGTQNISAFPQMLSAALTRADDSHRLYVDTNPGMEIAEGLPSQRVHKHKALINIMQGCNNFCTYCIVPYTRGRERSRAPEQVVSEVGALAADGVKEIMLLGQNVNSYKGMTEQAARSSDSTSGAVDFPALIYMLDDIDGIERIRFMTSHPKDLSDGLIRAFANAKHLCPAIHLPIQSGSTEILRRMNRGYTKEEYISLIARLRAERPDISVTTDFIVGFPGENEEDFAHTMDVIERVKFDAAFTFLYSARKGTPAAELPDDTPDEVKHERFERMVDRLNDISLEKNRAFPGRIEKVLIEGKSKTNDAALSGRTLGNKLVNFASPCGADADSLVGAIRNVQITEAGTFSLTGELCDQATL